MEDMDLNRLCYLVVKKNAVNKQRLAAYRHLRMLKKRRMDEVKKYWDELRGYCDYDAYRYEEHQYEDRGVQDHFLKHFKVGKQLNRERHDVEGWLFKCQDQMAELTKQIAPLLKYHNISLWSPGDNTIKKLFYKDCVTSCLESGTIQQNAEWYQIERDILS